MLVLSRYVGEEIVIGGDIHVQVLGFQGRKVRLGIRAPASVSVDRTEVSERRLKFPDGPPMPSHVLQNNGVESSPAQVVLEV